MVPISSSRWPIFPTYRISFMNNTRKFLSSDCGATAIEYSLIAGFVALAVIVGAQLAGNGLNTMFAIIGYDMEVATSTANSSGN